jgi:hypothetical protein
MTKAYLKTNAKEGPGIAQGIEQLSTGPISNPKTLQNKETNKK